MFGFGKDKEDTPKEDVALDELDDSAYPGLKDLVYKMKLEHFREYPDTPFPEIIIRHQKEEYDFTEYDNRPENKVDQQIILYDEDLKKTLDDGSLNGVAAFIKIEQQQMLEVHGAQGLPISELSDPKYDNAKQVVAEVKEEFKINHPDLEVPEISVDFTKKDSVNAKAFANGRDIVITEPMLEAYGEGGPEDLAMLKAVLYHEVAHIVEYQQGTNQQYKGRNSLEQLSEHSQANELAADQYAKEHGHGEALANTFTAKNDPDSRRSQVIEERYQYGERLGFERATQQDPHTLDPEKHVITHPHDQERIDALLNDNDITPQQYDASDMETEQPVQPTQGGQRPTSGHGHGH